MKILVQKFGGTSVANLECMKKVREKVQAGLNKGYKMVVVLSARSGETNRLLALASEWSSTPDPAECDSLVSTGEQVSIALFTMLLKDAGIRARSLLAWQIPIITDDDHGNARIESIDSQRLRSYLDEYDVLVVAGFQGCTESQRITTLGRGGSDTSAVALAAALGSVECEIYTEKCWKWPAWAPRCCTSVPWNLPRSTKCLCASAPLFPTTPARSLPRRTPAWKLFLFPALPMIRTRLV